MAHVTVRAIIPTPTQNRDAFGGGACGSLPLETMSPQVRTPPATMTSRPRHPTVMTVPEADWGLRLSSLPQLGQTIEPSGASV